MIRTGNRAGRSNCPFCRREYVPSDLRRLYDEDEDEVPAEVEVAQHDVELISYDSAISVQGPMTHTFDNDSSDSESNQMFTPYL